MLNESEADEVEISENNDDNTSSVTKGDSYSLRLGHLRGLTVHWTVIQYPQVATLLAAARSQNGSGVINTIHYRSAATLPRGEGL